MDLEKFRRTAARKRKSLSAFLQKLDEIVPEDFSRLVKKTDRQVWQKVHCMECAHCCKVMTPTYKKADIKRIAEFLKMNPKDFISKWLVQEKESGDWVNKQTPCQFLADDKCSVYEVRPKDCAEFPHHNKRPFDAYNETFKNNLDKCPATFLLVQRLKKIVERDYEW